MRGVRREREGERIERQGGERKEVMRQKIELVLGKAGLPL